MSAARAGPDPVRTLADVDEDLLAFWRERHLCTLATLRPDGTPHVVPVGATLDVDARLVRVIASGGSRKVRNVRDGGPSARVAVCQVDGRRWSTMEGTGRVLDEPEAVAEAEARYAARYRRPRFNPARVVIEVTVDRVLGSV